MIIMNLSLNTDANLSTYGQLKTGSFKLSDILDTSIINKSTRNNKTKISTKTSKTNKRQRQPKSKKIKIFKVWAIPNVISTTN